MANIILDTKYQNRWVDISDHTVKFENSVAHVEDDEVKFFENNPEFQIVERNPIKEVIVEPKPTEEWPVYEAPVKKSKKK